MKNKELVVTLNAINDTELLNKKLPVSLSYRLARNLKILSDAGEVYNRAAESLQKQHPDFGPEFRSEMEVLLEEDAGVGLLRTVEESMLENYDCDRYDPLTVREMQALEFMVSAGNDA